LITIYIAAPFPVTFGQNLLLSTLCGLTAPIMTLLVASFAANKIEGVALFKGINFLLVIPIVEFFFHDWQRHLFGILPVTWTYRAFESLIFASKSETFYGNLSAGFTMHLLLIYFLYHMFQKKVFRQMK